MTPGVALGVQAAQSQTSAGRGLGRYVTDASAAIVARVPGAVAQVSFSAELAPPAFLDQLPRSVPRGDDQTRPEWSGPLVYHVLSPLEVQPLDRVWPRWARRPSVGLTVTVHDLIPFIFPAAYMDRPIVQRWHAPRLALLRIADALVVPSSATAGDVIDRLGVDRSRIFVTGEDCGPTFRPAAEPREHLLAGLRRLVPGIRDGFLLFVGSTEFRKNLDRLLAAYAKLAPSLRQEHQLVMAGKLGPGEENHLRVSLRQHRIEADVLATGYIPDLTLARLYQLCDLFVFPSLYEGFGLPALEAMRCGARVLVADASSLPELVRDPAARFDPRSVEAIRWALERGLTDEAFRAQLQAMAAREAERFSWDRATTETLRAYGFALRRRVGLRR